MTTYVADDSDLPHELFEPVKPNRIETARQDILKMAKELGLSVSTDQLRLVAILLTAIREAEEERTQ